MTATHDSPSTARYGLLIVAGFLKAMWDRMPRYDDRAFRRDLQRWQYRRLLALLVGKGAR